MMVVEGGGGRRRKNTQTPDGRQTRTSDRFPQNPIGWQQMAERGARSRGFHRWIDQISCCTNDSRNSGMNPIEMERPLFGGSLSCDIPSDWIDLSDVRQVPDHQECWQDRQDRLFVVELLGLEASAPPDSVAEFYFNDLAAANGSGQELSFTKQPSLFQISGLPDSATLHFGVGYQTVAMGRDTDVWGNPRQQDVRHICIELCVIRLPHVHTDVLVTLSTPSAANPHDDTDAPHRHDTFRRMASTLQVRNWSLFSPSNT